MKAVLGGRRVSASPPVDFGKHLVNTGAHCHRGGGRHLAPIESLEPLLSGSKNPNWSATNVTAIGFVQSSSYFREPRPLSKGVSLPDPVNLRKYSIIYWRLARWTREVPELESF